MIRPGPESASPDRRYDFLHKDAQTPLREHYIAGGAACSLSTNSQQILESARGSFLPLERPESIDFSMRFWVDGSENEQPPWPKPYVRGLDHLVFAGFGVKSSMLADLRTRRVIGRFSTTMAADGGYWRTVIFPILLSIIAGSVGIVELHASCVARDDQGLILMGPSRSGKSTLSMALAQVGFRFLSDDRTFCALRHGRLEAYGLPRPLKLRREAGHWFDEFRDREPTHVQNGEQVFHCDPNRRSRQQHLPMCEPKLLVFLERLESPAFCMKPLNRSEARSCIETELLAEAHESVEKQATIIDNLLSIPRVHLRYGGQPQLIAEEISASFVSHVECWASRGTN